MIGIADIEPVTRDLLVQWFEAQIPRPESVGLEIEYGLVRPDTGLPVKYPERQGQSDLLHLIAGHLGGEPLLDGRALIGLTLSDGSHLSLEAGSALEYSGPPSASMTEAVVAARSCQLRLAELAGKLGISLLSGGCLPFDEGAISWVPKPRTGIMLHYFRHLGASGRSAAQVMGRSLSTQVTLDAHDVPEYLEKLHTLLRISPYIAALMVNSPALRPLDRATAPVASTRMSNWRAIDPARCQRLTRDLVEVATLADLVDALVAVPMIFRMSSGGPVPGPPGSFADLMAGAGPAAPTLSDWIWHLSQLWPAVRPRQTLETRLPDGQSWADLAVLPALWLGLMGDSEIRRQAIDITAGPAVLDRLTVAAAGGVLALPGADREICRELVRLSRSGLAARVASGAESAELLEALDVVDEIAYSGKTPADRLLAQWESAWRRRPEAYVQAMSVPTG